MIDRALPTQPISKFRQAGQEILDELDSGPVLLISTTVWFRISAHLTMSS